VEIPYKIILGIGNPGEKYKDTRHNLGFNIVEDLAKYFKVSFEAGRFYSLNAQTHIAKQKILLVKPLTYVNRSGICAQTILQWYKLSPSSFLIVVDDIALPLGKIRLRKKGSSGGHNGLKSIIASFDTEEIPRLRIGIGKPQNDLSSFVLSPFTEDEQTTVEKAIIEARESVLAWIQEGAGIFGTLQTKVDS